MRWAAVWGALGCLSACSNAGSTNGATVSPSASGDDAGGSSVADAARPSIDGPAPPVVDATVSPGNQVPPSTVDGSAPAIDAAFPPAADATLPPTDAGVSPSPDASLPMAWLAYNYAPSTRTLVPTAVRVHGNVTGSDAGALFGQPMRLNGAGAGLTFDFGREVAGIVSLKFGGASDAAQAVGLAFCESSQFIGPVSDLSTGGVGVVDGALAVNVTPSTTYVMPANKLRGGFRYLSVFLTTGGWVEVSGASLNFTAAPAMPVPNQYTNYFYSNDDLLNRIWYAGAYTVQLNTIDPRQGRAWPAPDAGWDNGATIGSGSSVLVDGAKRDRTVWPGDLGIAVPTAYVSTGDLLSTKNSIDTLFAGQDPTTGEFPRSGPPLNAQNGHTSSDTYHLWTLVGAYNYFLYSGDKAWVDKNWAAYKKGLAFSTAKISASGLFQVTLVKDWGRLGQGGENIAANAILYRLLVASVDLAAVEGDTTASSSYKTQAASLKAAANTLLWDSTVGAYRDNPASTLYPQDGNALAIWFGLVDSAAKAQSINAALRKNWNAHGAHTPEGDPGKAMISPFPGSMEVAARFVSNDDQGALDLVRLEWGYMLGAPIGTASTFWEGYLDDGSFGYFDAGGLSYMSAAHGWSSGPTFAMTQWVLGVAPDSAAGQTYHVIPHVGDLVHVEGSLAVAPGKSIVVSYDHPACGDFTLRVDSSTHAGSLGVVGIPRFGQTRVVQLNGATVWDGTALVASSAVATADQDATFIYLRGMPPMKAVFSFYPKACP
jgi:Bacterial alpha-L-rhamnosidase 6 hairpin glycosidase domain